MVYAPTLEDLPPIILTAALSDEAFAFFDGMRRKHFPAHRNHIPAHLTFFHKLPGAHEAMIVEEVRSVCRQHAPIPMQVTRPYSLGCGVAYQLESAEMQEVRGGLANVFEPWLTPQDRAPFRPHITIQNKVAPADAQLLLESLTGSFTPFHVEAVGVLIWRYLGGPWEEVARVAFVKAPDADTQDTSDLLGLGIARPDRG